MGNVYVQKRGNVFQYQFQIASVDGKRKYKNKSGFSTRNEAFKEGVKAYTEYMNTGHAFAPNEISYSDYLDYWLDNYCKTNLRYRTVQTYATLINKYIKPKIGMYRLSTITSVRLNMFITDFMVTLVT